MLSALPHQSNAIHYAELSILLINLVSPHSFIFFNSTCPWLFLRCYILDDSRQDKLDPKAIVFFLGTHILRTVINVRTLSLVTVLCLLMLPSLRVHRSFHLKVDH